MCEKSIFCLFLESQSSVLQQAHIYVSVWFDLMTSDKGNDILLEYRSLRVTF